MNVFFRHQLADYVEYHRDPNNCVLHVFGIIFLFLAAVLPLSLWHFPVFGLRTNAATFMVVPVLVYWVLLDVVIGLGIIGAAIVVLLAAAAISSHASVAAVWMISIGLIVVGLAAQIIGHQVFEARRPALMDHPTHLLLGPMFVMAKLFIAFGFRNDLAVIIQQGSQLAAGAQSAHQHQRQGDGRQDP